MTGNSYFSFVKWYFVYIGKKWYRDTPAMRGIASRDIRRWERLPVVVFAYLLLPAAVLLYWLLPPFGILFSIVCILAAIGLLALCQFSFIYYYVAYIKYKNRDSSIRDRLIVDEFILFNSANDIRRTISRFFRVVTVSGNMFSLKIHLIDKAKMRSKNARIQNKDIITLKFKPDAVFWGKEKIFDGKLQDMVDLEKLLSEVQRKTGGQ